jgi:hypothetical protein
MASCRGGTTQVGSETGIWGWAPDQKFESQTVAMRGAIGLH